MRSDVTVMFRKKRVMGGGSRGQLSVIQKMQVGTDLASHVSALPYFHNSCSGVGKTVENSDEREIRTRDEEGYNLAPLKAAMRN